jgi:hypothetical protein
MRPGAFVLDLIPDPRVVHAFETGLMGDTEGQSYSHWLTWERLPMELTDWIIMLAIVLFAISFFCGRAPASWSLENRARRFRGTRLLVQAALALWAALLLLARAFCVLDGLSGRSPAPHSLLAGVVVLFAFGCYWTIRACKLLKPRRLFTVQ